MLLSPWSRAAQRKAAPHLTGFAPISCTAKAVLSRPLNRSGHQRRHSSSKSSSPQNDAPETIAAPSGTVSKKSLPASNTTPRKRAATRVGRQKPKDVPLEASEMKKDATASQIAVVASTQHLHPHGMVYLFPRLRIMLTRQDIHVASFFSIHRPISVTAPVPTISSSTEFSTIFEPRSPPPPRPSDVIYTLTSAVQTLEKTAIQAEGQRSSSSAQTDESDLRTVFTQASTSNAEPSNTTTHLDGQPYQGLFFNVQEIAQKFRPFVVPPPPIPMMDEEPTQKTLLRKQPQKHQHVQTQFPRSPQDNQFFTTNIRTQSHPSNNSNSSSKGYTHKLPLSERLARLRLEPNPYAEPESNIIPESMEDQRPAWQPSSFLERMRLRQQKWEDANGRRKGNCVWKLISVKRQRKLKMKKHKYKKLMKRTRNLRRRLDKL
ncbi:MAG: hypothetical protein MMC33_001826 [Icmadophila ericetorum]|nr:hypothetical protein [Icmadophila ericetorum]